MSTPVPTDADLNRYVTARAADVKRRMETSLRKKPGIGPLQQRVLQALRRQPLSVMQVLHQVVLTSWDPTVDALAGLLARELIEPHGDGWRAVAREAAA